MGSIPGLGRFPGVGNGSPLQYSCLENPMDRGAWHSTVHKVEESDKTEQLSTKHSMELVYMVMAMIWSKRRIRWSRRNCSCGNSVDISKSTVLKKNEIPKWRVYIFIDAFFFHLLTNFIMKFMLNLIQRGENICSDTSQAPGGDVQLWSILCHLSTCLGTSG